MRIRLQTASTADRDMPIRRSRAATLASVTVALVTLAAIGVRDAHATFPGDNGLIAFHSNEDNGNFDIYVMNPDGTGKTRLTDSPFPEVFPTFSPDGAMIAFTCRGRCGEQGEQDLYVMNSDGTGRRNLTPGPADGHHASFSPDGRQIAIQVMGATETDIWVMNADGTGRLNLTNDPTALDLVPSWSPSGREIVFQKSPFNRSDGALYVIPAQGGVPKQRTNGIVGAGTPNWSPDGRDITFSDNFCACPESDVFVIGANGSKLRQLTNTPHNELYPSLSPEGDRIVYQRNDIPGQLDIFTVDTDGDGVRQLTATPWHEGGPSWGLKP